MRHKDITMYEDLLDVSVAADIDARISAFLYGTPDLGNNDARTARYCVFDKGPFISFALSKKQPILTVTKGKASGPPHVKVDQTIPRWP